MSLRGAERRSKLKDKIASPLARNDTVGRKERGIKGVRLPPVRFPSGLKPLRAEPNGVDKNL